MIFARKILPFAVFGLSLAGTLLVRKHHAPETASPTREVDAHPKASRTKTHREESSFAAVRSLLRQGETDQARELLRQLGQRNPVAFFKLLSRLPGLPGMDDIIRETAGLLPWNQPAVTELLNGISSNPWRDVAWDGYITPKVGVLPDEEIYRVGVSARESRFMSALGSLFKDAAEKRPDSFLAFLNSGNSTFFRVGFFEELMKFHPERAAELFDTIPDGAGGGAYDKSYILQTRVRIQPTAENLEAALLERGDRGIYDWGASSSLVSTAYPKASVAEKAKILDWIANQPAIARNRLLDGIAFSTEFQYNAPIAPAEFFKVLATYTSGPMQEQAMDRWLKGNPEQLSKDPGWIDDLPTERLRNHARDRMRMASPEPDR